MDLSGQNAMSADDVKTLETGYLLNLPRDEKKRTVLYYDRSKRPHEDKASPRILFFALQSAMQNEAELQTDGFILLINVSNPFASSFNNSKIQLASSLIKHSMACTVKKVHLICHQPRGQCLLPAPDRCMFLLRHTR
jgi:hypothetical protein